MYDNLLAKCEIFYAKAEASKDYLRNYMRNRYHEKRQKVIKELGGKCVRCNSKKDLQFDHKDSKKKKIRMADLHSVSDKKLKEELKNIQLLCKKCHQEKSHKAWDFGSPKPTHGTYSMYQKHKCRCSKCVSAYKNLLKERKSRRDRA